MYQAIRATAYEPDPRHGPWQEELRVLPLGEELHQELTRLHSETASGSRHPDRLPVRQLNALLQALAPGVIATGRRAGTDGRLPWLYAREAVPPEALAPLIGTWAATRFAGDDDGDGPDLEQQLLTTEGPDPVRLPHWESERIDLTETVTSAGGTAEPASRLYHLLPESIAFRLAARPFRTRGATLHFRVESAGDGTRLISWPPQQYEHRKQTWFYSACLTITVQTVPFAPRFRVHVSTGVRRWTTQLDLRPHQLSGATVLLDAPLPWPEGPDRGYRLAVNSLGYDRRLKEVTWRHRSPAPLLPELDIVRHYPEPAELLTHPERWIHGCGEVAAGIVHHTSLGPHGVGSGLMPLERAELDAWVEEGLRPMLRRVADLTRATRNNTPALIPRSGPRAEPEAREAQLTTLRRTALIHALNGRPLEVEIHWQSPQTRAALLAELPKLIGATAGERVRSDADGTWQWRSDGIEIRVRARPAGPLADALPVSRERKRPRAVRFAEAVEGRCALVAERMAPPRTGLGLVIAEIADKDRFAAVPDSDPKHALRIAWARQGWLSQFVNPSDGTDTALEHRARWTWLDAFRQLGAVTTPAHRAGAGIPGDLQYAALWLVRHTRKGPTRCPVRRLVAVRVRPGDGPGALQGWDAERAEWVPYPKLLRLLSTTPEPAAEDSGTDHRGEHPDATPRERRAVDSEGAALRAQRETESQVRALLFQLRDRPTLLMVDAANLRQCWPRLRNGSLARDMLGFGTEPDQRLTTYGSDLRLVSVRDANNREEVAEWYAYDARGRVGFAEGVWGAVEPENRVFASTAAKPHTAKLHKGLMKLVPTAEDRRAPGKTAWNPAQLEITVLGCLSEKALADSGREGKEPDRPADWATLAHQMRYLDDYPPLARPLPLHLARLAGEYVLPVAATKTARETESPVRAQVSDPAPPTADAD